MFHEPVRSMWHGKAESQFIDSFIDINKVYHSVFQMFGICEAFSSLSVPHDEGDYNMIMPPMRYNILEGKGFVAFGSDLVELDSILLGITEPYIIQDKKTNVDPIRSARDILGSVKEETIVTAKRVATDWVTTKTRITP